MKRKKAAALRKFGLELVGNVPWGTHLCQFYETKEDLINILVPYFTEGLRNNEFCMWITAPPLETEEAKQALKKSVPELDQYIQKGQIEILPYTEWYLLGGSFNSDRVLRDWVKKEKAAFDFGFDGLRLTGNTFWLERNGWKAFTEYEEQVNNVIGRHKMIAVCTYCLGKCNSNEVIDVVKNHQFALIKRSGKWELIESSETKKVQRALLSSEKKFSVLYSSMIEGVAFHDVVYDSSGKAVDYILTDVNPSFEKITGLPKKQVIGKRASELYGTGEPPYLEVFAKVASSGKPASFETYFQPMQKHFSISVFSPSKGKFTTVFHDITQHRQAEEALRESQHDLNRAQAVAKTGSWRLDVQRNELLWSDETHRMFGIPKGTPLTYETFLGTVHPDDREYVDREWKASLRGEHYDIEHRIVVNREVKWVREKAELEFDKNGALLGGFGTVQDITERKRTEQELFDTLRESQRRQSEISALLKASKTVLQNREFKVSARTIFDSCKELLGAAAGYVALLSGDGKNNAVLFLESGGLPCSVDPSLPMPVRGLRAETYSTGKVVIENSFPKNKWSKLLPSGHVGLENVLFAPLTVDGRTVGVIGLANKPGGFTERDAQMALAFGELASIALINSEMLEMLEENAKKLKTQSEHLEELIEERTRQLKDAERLAAIGQTAGMVGHDMRNPLQSILGDVYLAKMDLASLPDSEEKEGLQESLEAIEKQTEYINKIVLDLQDFAKPLNPHDEETDIEIIINELLVRNGVPKNIQTDAKVDVDAKTMMADSAYIKRILGNLVSNAVQAMPNGGKLTLRAYREASDIVITVEDTGVGIPEEAKPKLFQPLFTTKSKGQGFGLSVVKRLTEALNGTITFESQEGKGTKFALRFSSPPKNR